MLNKTLMFLWLTLIFVSCFDAKKQKLIIGNWKGISWLVDGQPAPYLPEHAAFIFDENGGYTYRFAEHVETCKYNVANNQLFTTPEGGNRMMVKIVKLEGDTLVFDMNRSGQSELLTLVRDN